MKTVGIVTEYNPLHHGHAWQINQVQSQLGPNCAVVVAMSGSFTQRGEPAVLDKWTRTRMALACGASLVLELPTLFATASAERFASGGVQLLAATGITRTLVFGSESGQIEPLQSLADQLVAEPPAFKAELARLLDEGCSFAAARQQALASVLDRPEQADLLDSANNILAVEYLKAIARLPDKNRLSPVKFQRQGQGYLDETIESSLTSATAIRKVIQASPHDLAQLLQRLSAAMPAPALAILLEAIASGTGPVGLEDLTLPVLMLLRTREPASFAGLPGMGEGLAQRLSAIARRPQTQAELAPDANRRMADLVDAAMSRRFPRTRVQRALTALLLNISADDYQLADNCGGPAYIRVLGFDKNGRYLLKLMRQKASLPIITRGSDFLEHSQNQALQRQAQLDLAATDLWMTAAGKLAGADFDRPVVIR